MRSATILCGSLPRLIVLCTVTYAVYHFIVPELNDASGQLALDLPPLRLLLAGTLLFLCSNACAAMAWGLLVDPGRSRLTTAASICRVWMLSNVGKYLPGSLFLYAGRYTLGRRQGLGRVESTVGLVIEIASIVLIALLVSLPGLSGLFPVDTFSDLVRANIAHAATLTWTVAAGLVLCSAVAWFVVRTGRLDHLAHLHAAVRRHLKGQRIGTSWTLSSLFQLGGLMLAGFAAEVLLDTAGIVSVPDYTSLTSAYALAFLAGFLLVGAPGGLGVRELALVALLSPDIGTLAAVNLATALRICSLLADVTGALLALGLAEKGASGASSTTCPVSAGTDGRSVVPAEQREGRP